jgi:hypothetical protein
MTAGCPASIAANRRAPGSDNREAVLRELLSFAMPSATDPARGSRLLAVGWRRLAEDKHQRNHRRVPSEPPAPASRTRIGCGGVGTCSSHAQYPSASEKASSTSVKRVIGRAAAPMADKLAGNPRARAEILRRHTKPKGGMPHRQAVVYRETFRPRLQREDTAWFPRSASSPIPTSRTSRASGSCWPIGTRNAVRARCRCARRSIPSSCRSIWAR